MATLDLRSFHLYLAVVAIMTSCRKDVEVPTENEADLPLPPSETSGPMLACDTTQGLVTSIGITMDCPPLGGNRYADLDLDHDGTNDVEIQLITECPLMVGTLAWTWIETLHPAAYLLGNRMNDTIQQLVVTEYVTGANVPPPYLVQTNVITTRDCGLGYSSTVVEVDTAVPHITRLDCGDMIDTTDHFVQGLAQLDRTPYCYSSNTAHSVDTLFHLTHCYPNSCWTLPVGEDLYFGFKLEYVPGEPHFGWIRMRFGAHYRLILVESTLGQ